MPSKAVTCWVVFSDDTFDSAFMLPPIWFVLQTHVFRFDSLSKLSCDILRNYL